MAITYDVERDGVIVATGVTMEAFDDTGLTPDTEYTYRVRPVDEFGFGEWSDPFVVRTDASAGSPLFFEPFTYPNGTLVASSGGVWIERSVGLVLGGATTDWDIVSNQLDYSGPTSSTRLALVNVPPVLPAQYSIGVDVHAVNMTFGQRAGIVFRSNRTPGDPPSYLSFDLTRFVTGTGPPTHFQVSERNGGSTSIVQPATPLSGSITAPFRMYLLVDGNDLGYIFRSPEGENPPSFAQSELPPGDWFSTAINVGNTDLGLFVAQASGQTVTATFDDFTIYDGIVAPL